MWEITVRYLGDSTSSSFAARHTMTDGSLDLLRNERILDCTVSHLLAEVQYAISAAVAAEQRGQPSQRIKGSL